MSEHEHHSEHHEHDHEHHSHTVDIIINARLFNVPKGQISFSTIINYVFPHGTGSQDQYTVTYEMSGNEHRPEGILVAGTSVKIKKGTVFVVSPTGQS